tara:strand:+ start:34 stop:366 length:333 start_codon:yes stop_codon:yes gene_type:complete
MIIRYERTVEYEIDVSPVTILKYAKDYIDSEQPTTPIHLHVSLEDIVNDITEDVKMMNLMQIEEDQIDYSQPINACFPRLHEDDDPFCGVGITIEQLEENLKKLSLNKEK